MAGPTTRRVVILSLAAVGSLAVLALVILGVAATGEPRRSSPDRVAIGKREGHLVLYACTAGGIGKAEVARGTSPDGQLVWSAAVADGPSLQQLPLDGQIAGYEVAGADVFAESPDEVNLNNLTDSADHPLLESVLTFRPSEIPEGSVRPARGGERTISDWTAAQTCS
jgi:hypothetical protein